MEHLYKPSKIAMNTYNPIRKYQENRSKQYPNHSKSKIMFHVGDPTLSEDFRPHQKALDLMAKETKMFGYIDHSYSSQKYLAEKYSNNLWKLDVDDVTLTCGASNALWITILSLCDEGDVLLGPEPGFPLAKTICNAFGIVYKSYELEMNNNWQINLDSLKELVCHKTKAILVNNPSNPTGAVWSKEEVIRVVKKCEELSLPIVSDEVYEGFCFKEHQTCSFGEVNTKVPVFVIGSASKKLFAPGWRIGWILFFGEKEALKDIKTAIRKLIHFIMVPDIISTQHLHSVMKIYEEEKYIESRIQICEDKYNYLKSVFKDVKGFKLNECQGGIFGTIGIEMENFKEFKLVSDMTLKLEEEQNLYFMPGDLFGKNNFMRFSNLADKDQMNGMVERLKEFSQNHYNN